MNLKRKYEKFKLKVSVAEKKKETFRGAKSWLELRELKKKKLALKEAFSQLAI